MAVGRTVNLATIGTRTLLIYVIAFPVLVFFQCALWFVLPFLVPLVAGAAMALGGVVLAIAVLWRLWLRRDLVHVALAGVVAMTWLAWICVPTQEFAVHVRFWLERPGYDRVVVQVARGERPSCVKGGDCFVEGNAEPYVIFPFPGFLSAWIGIVHVPASNQAPVIERLKTMSGDAGCDPGPIAPHYYVCTFY